MFHIDLQWLSFSINLDAVETWMKTNAGPDYVGNSADKDLTLWFANEPVDDIKAAIQAYWDGLSTASPEATGYKTAEQVQAEAEAAKAAALASAASKLEALGLSPDEIKAILGQ